MTPRSILLAPILLAVLALPAGAEDRAAGDPLLGQAERRPRYRAIDYYGIPSGRHRRRRHEFDDRWWYNHEREERAPRPRSVIYPNGIHGAVFDMPYPELGVTPKARAYIYDHTYDPDSFYGTGWRNR